MVSRTNKTSLGRFLFVGPVTDGRRKLIEDLQALGMHAERAASMESASGRLKNCDFVLFATAERSEIPQLKKAKDAGKAAALLLRHEDKALAPLGLKAGARSVLVDEVHPDEVVQFVQGSARKGFFVGRCAGSAMKSARTAERAPL